MSVDSDPPTPEDRLRDYCARAGVCREDRDYLMALLLDARAETREAAAAACEELAHEVRTLPIGG